VAYLVPFVADLMIASLIGRLTEPVTQTNSPT